MNTSEPVTAVPPAPGSGTRNPVRLAIRPFTAGDIEAAASLLAGRHASDLAREPVLPERFVDAAACLPLAEALAAKGDGVAATRDGKLVGYLLTDNSPPHDPQRRALVPLEGHAIAGGEDAETYREMYAALAPVLIRRGIFAHQVLVPASDALSNQAWFSLGFGQRMHVASRGLEDVQGTSAEVDIRLADPEDIEAVWDLFVGLGRYNTTAPLFIPDVYDDDAWRKQVEKDLGDPATAFWLAQSASQPIAVMYVRPFREPAMDRHTRTAHLNIAFARRSARRSGAGTALLSRCIGWARDNGYECMSLEFFTFNLAGAEFWLGHGFRPIATFLERRLDSRIAWADGTNL